MQANNKIVDVWRRSRVETRREEARNVLQVFDELIKILV